MSISKNKVSITSSKLALIGVILGLSVGSAFALNLNSNDVSKVPVAKVKKAEQQVLRLSEPVASDADSETFGELMQAGLPEVALSSLESKPTEHLGNTFVVKTKIAKVCQKKGCFFIAQDGNTVIRVSFKDYGFFIPTDTAGRTVTLAGQLVEKQLSEEQAAHYRSDLRSNAELADAIQSGKVYEIVASAIRIPKA